ncbi:PQ loop repeat-domain-containing protein [Limtongia smithiae]|uniref:PQ loop repeat-domain-containing protein n=1 Tax=Limtongia smithiae TaxID=1125753 RepID=UPI0034CD7210
MESEAQPFRVVLSGVLGFSSIACWVVLLVPQLVDQWRSKSSDGVSLLFLTAWFLGDLANLVGAVWARLLRPVVLLAVWFCVADAVELGSACYYRYMKVAQLVDSDGEEDAVLIDSNAMPEEDEDEQVLEDDDAGAGTPLLPTDSVAVAALHDASRRDSSGNVVRPQNLTSRRSQLAATFYRRVLVNYVLPVAGVFVAGTVMYAFSDKSANSGSDDDDSDGKIGLAIGPQVLGYISAALYLSARVPQILQNHRRKSVRGLSLLFFMYSTIGNVTYALQILCYSTEARYVLLNLSWLLGSLGTVAQDAVIFAQFYLYRERVPSAGDDNT